MTTITPTSTPRPAVPEWPRIEQGKERTRKQESNNKERTMKQHRIKSVGVAGVLAVMGMLVAGLPTVAQGQSIQTINLGAGGQQFWDGDYVDLTTSPPAGQGSYDYTLITENGA